MANAGSLGEAKRAMTASQVRREVRACVCVYVYMAMASIYIYICVCVCVCIVHGKTT